MTPPEVLIHDLGSRPDLEEAVLTLIEKNFPTGSPTPKKISLREEFFLLLDPKNLSRVLFICDENDQPVSALAWKMFQLHESYSGKSITVAGIGLVVTNEKHRGQGFSSSLLNEAENRARKEGALLCYLWSGLDFYQKRDYLPLGSELSWILDSKERDLLDRRLSTEGLPSNFKVTPATSLNLSACQKLFEDLKIGPLRSKETLSGFLNLAAVHFNIVFDAQQKIVGYGLDGKARDLQNTLHEIVGPREVVPHLLRSLIDSAPRDEKNLVRIQYPIDGPLAEELKYWLGEKAPEAFALVKLLDPKAFANYLAKVPELSGITLELQEEGFRILGPDHEEEFFSPDPSHLTQLFMSPFHPNEFGTLSPNLMDALEDFKSLNPYFWGVDSV